MRTREDLIEQTERHHILVRDFHLARGVFRPRTQQEQTQADQFAANVAQAQASGLENAEILAELQKLQEQKSSWTATLPILVISVVLFLVLGAKSWNWQFTLWLIPILFFHEAGHWAAMRLFHYRNLRMFFIPLFGAAVTGRNWNVPGWKKAIVSLAGPLPGIALGIFLGVAGIAWHLPGLSKAAFLLILLNGFNLLPILPMDGGHVLQAILFCRNRWLDVIFRLLAIGGLFLMSIAHLSKVFLPLAIFMAVSLPTSFKLAQIADKLRKTPLLEPQPGEDLIPVPTAQTIIAEIKAAFPKNLGHKQIASLTLNIFETLNAKPPGTLGTLGLLAVHGGTFVLVLIFGLVLAVSRFANLGDFASMAMRQPLHAYACGSARQWQGTNFTSVSAAPHNLLVATFKKHSQAEMEFQDLTPQLPATGRLVLFGDSLLLALPAADDAAREKWFDQLQAATTNVFVAISNQPVSLHLRCVAPTLTTATNLSLDLQNYFYHPGMHLIPPWSSEYSSPAFATNRHAREFLGQLDTLVNHTRTNSALRQYPQK